MQVTMRAVLLCLIGTVFVLVYGMIRDGLPLYLGIPGIFATSYITVPALAWTRFLSRIIRHDPDRR